MKIQKFGMFLFLLGNTINIVKAHQTKMEVEFIIFNYGAFVKILFKSLFKMILWVIRKWSFSHDVITIGFPMKNWSHNMYNMLA